MTTMSDGKMLTGGLTSSAQHVAKSCGFSAILI